MLIYTKGLVTGVGWLEAQGKSSGFQPEPPSLRWCKRNACNNRNTNMESFEIRINDSIWT